jgi:hypothetical protein
MMPIGSSRSKSGIGSFASEKLPLRSTWTVSFRDQMARTVNPAAPARTSKKE